MSLNIIRRNIQNILINKESYVYNQYISKKSIREISHKYNVPESSIYKIVKSLCTSLHSNRDENLDAQFSYKLNEEEKQFIRGFVKPPRYL